MSKEREVLADFVENEFKWISLWNNLIQNKVNIDMKMRCRNTVFTFTRETCGQFPNTALSNIAKY